MEEDRKKIDAYLKELNKGDKGPWNEATGFSGVPSITLDKDGKPSLDTSGGLTVKIFANTKTGETKIFYYEKFLKKD